MHVRSAEVAKVVQAQEVVNYFGDYTGYYTCAGIPVFDGPTPFVTNCYAKCLEYSLSCQYYVYEEAQSRCQIFTACSKLVFGGTKETLIYMTIDEAWGVPAGSTAGWIAMHPPSEEKSFIGKKHKNDGKKKTIDSTPQGLDLKPSAAVHLAAEQAASLEDEGGSYGSYEAPPENVYLDPLMKGESVIAFQHAWGAVTPTLLSEYLLKHSGDLKLALMDIFTDKPTLVSELLNSPDDVQKKFFMGVDPEVREAVFEWLVTKSGATGAEATAEAAALLNDEMVELSGVNELTDSSHDVDVMDLVNTDELAGASLTEKQEGDTQSAAALPAAAAAPAHHSDRLPTTTKVREYGMFAGAAALAVVAAAFVVARRSFLLVEEPMLTPMPSGAVDQAQIAQVALAVSSTTGAHALL
jgi:hypothetical protein